MLSVEAISRRVACIGLLAAGACASIPTKPVSLPDGFVRLRSVAPTIVQDIRYASANNFLGRRVDGYEAAECILARPAAEALARVQAQLSDQGLVLIVFDCYRPQRAVDDFVGWSETQEARTKHVYYPNLQKENLFKEGYIARRSGHSRGSTVDLALAKQNTSHLSTQPKDIPCTDFTGAARSDDYLDFGTAYDCFDTLSNTDDPRIQGGAAQNRTRLVEIMKAEGFVNYPLEWWHFTYQPEAFPDQYFDFRIE